MVEEDDGEEETTRAELARWDEGNLRFLELAQKAQAELDCCTQRAESGG